MKIFTSDLKKKYTIFHTFHDIAQFLLSVFELVSGNKLLMSVTTANTSLNVSWSVIVSDYIE